MASRSIFVTWPMEAEVRAVLERVGTVRTSRTEHELPVAELARHVADAEAIIPMGEGHRPPNLVNPKAWRPA